MDEKILMQMFSSLLDKKLEPLSGRLEPLSERIENLNDRLEKLEGGQQVMIKKIDNVSKQVADNTEKHTSVKEVAVKVAEHDTDIKLLKKFITN